MSEVLIFLSVVASVVGASLLLEVLCRSRRGRRWWFCGRAGPTQLPESDKWNVASVRIVRGEIKMGYR